MGIVKHSTQHHTASGASPRRHHTGQAAPAISASAAVPGMPGPLLLPFCHRDPNGRSRLPAQGGSAIPPRRRMRSWRNGRRASLRCLWGKPRGSSSLLDRILTWSSGFASGSPRPRGGTGPASSVCRLTRDWSCSAHRHRSAARHRGGAAIADAATSRSPDCIRLPPVAMHVTAAWPQCARQAKFP